MDFTVAIPTYNGAERLPAVLNRLLNQTGTEKLRWEVIVCDNNSRDETAAVVREIQSKWQQAGAVSLRYCFAPEQGAAFARQRAVEAAAGQWIGFLDDDNLPALDWVAQAHAFVAARPQVGVVGSQVLAQLDGELPEYFPQIAPFLAIVERGCKPHCYDEAVKVLPPGAGLVVRRELWLAQVPRRLFLNHKGKAAGLASEDLEAVLYLRRSGCEIWYNPDQVVAHHIPEERLQADYLASLFRCIGFSRLYVRLLGRPTWQRPFLIPLYWVNDLRRLVMHLLQYPPSLDAQTELLAQCDRIHLAATLVSPIKLAKKAILDRAQSVQDRWHFPHREAWLSALTAALEADQFQLYGQSLRSLQPADASSGMASGVERSMMDGSAPGSVAPTEILLRMVPELAKLVQPLPSPREFMALAVRYGLTARIDRWVIRQVLQRLATLPDASGKWEGPRYSINLSAASLWDDSLAAFLERQLQQRSLPATLLTFELDETLLWRQYDRLLPGLQALQSLGCSLTLDNFAQRLSQQQMAQLPLGYLKFSPASLRNIARRNSVEPFQQWAGAGGTVERHPTGNHGWRLSTVAKGIETPMALAQVTRAGLDYAQGYGVARPRPLEQCGFGRGDRTFPLPV